MKKPIEDSPEARPLAIVPQLARRLGTAARADLPFSATSEERTALLGSISGSPLLDFDAEDMASCIEVACGHDRGHPDTVFVAFMRDCPGNDQKLRQLWYWPDGTPYALMWSDNHDADAAANR